MKSNIAIFLSACALAFPPMIHAQAQPAASAASPATALTEGEVRKIDIGARKITLKHGEIKNLDMPPMTMVFAVRDEAVLGKIKPGDKVRFRAIDDGGTLTVVEIEAAK